MQDQEEIIENEYLINEHSKGLADDLVAYVLRNSRPFLMLYKVTNLGFVAKFVYGMIGFHLDRAKREWEHSPYQSVLSSIISDINEVLIASNGLPRPIEIQFKDVRGFDIFNATASPWFGENIVMIQSGVFWFSHIFVRSLEPLIRGKNSRLLTLLLKNHFKKKFFRTATAFITKNHTKSFSKFHFMYGNDSLLKGLELFIVAHEYAHLLIAQNGLNSFDFGKYYSENIIKLILTDEEITADAISLIILKLHSAKDEDELLMYSPRLLFLLLSLFEESHLMAPQMNHPLSSSRLLYIKNMIQELTSISTFDSVDDILNKIWHQGRQKVLSCVKDERNKQQQTIAMFLEVQNYMIGQGLNRLIRFVD